ncbi:hypothetical protein J2X31_003659 [Flavobacterium arsenatis]|uniref:Uncharacterized protein n=1 Tax=Flavobacterium arsenatis TaxID=1484332 RepID=A0ABU1TUT4_9FLAO|nr:hypothetical protein [Flavobacterium arsenatis]MDR6969626.1 hypothetical protein [Flavobacterium arsenatis]
MIIILIILILFLLIILFVILFSCYKIIVWISKTKTRTYWALSLLGILIFAKIIDYAFFTNMEFIQSKVYPHLYLVKNEINDRDSLNSIIKKMAIEKMNKEFIGNEDKFKYKYEYTEGSRTDLQYSLSFYTYFEGWGTNPFGQAGTAHFIDNEEDPGGFSSEELSHYREYQIAELYITFCENDTLNYIATITYYQNEYDMKKDTLINKCIQQEKEVLPKKEIIPYKSTHSGAGGVDYPSESKK